MPTLDQAYGARLVTRAAWGARAAQSRSGFTPDAGSTVHYEGPTLGAFPHTSCPSKVRGIQAFHMDQRGWADIAYSLMPCPHGAIFECRGRGWRTAANGTNEGNDSAHAVCALLGVGDPCPDVMLDAIAIACAWLNAPAQYGDKINGHRDWKPTACPGADLYADLPEIRARSFWFASGSVVIPPAPPAIIGLDLSEESMRKILVSVPVAQNRGYLDLRTGVQGLTETFSADRVVAITMAGDNPSDGWGPSNRRAPELVNASGVARIVVPEHDVTTGNVGVYVTVADAA